MRILNGAYHKIWRTVRKIPKGKVATYGQVARVCGLPGQARLVGYALHFLPHGFDVPWHRVVNAQGKISFPQNSSSYKRQHELLSREGVRSLRGRIDLTKFRWNK